MNLRELSKPQWDAALNAARVLANGCIDNASDRARFREAKAALQRLLPDDTAAIRIISDAVRWNSLNSICERVGWYPDYNPIPNERTGGR